MTTLPSKKRRGSLVLLLLISSSKLFFLSFISTAAAADLDFDGKGEGRCEKSNLYQCPNCGGITVSDCLQCDGYLNADQNHGICFSRKLFSTHEFLDHEGHYPFLWNDIVGAIIWFLAAGVATACGVGGGGIYVPLGIILLRFSSKPASGLSQASIFGASLGGLILNIRGKHPDKKIRDTVGNRREGFDEDKLRIIPYGEGMTPAELKRDEELYLASSEERRFYTRPLIDYDMALFLAPMEMAGAVMGVIIQKLMPNWLFLSLAGLILGATSVKTFQKFFSAYKKEKNARNERRWVEECGCNGAENPQSVTGDQSDIDGESCIQKDKNVKELECVKPVPLPNFTNVHVDRLPKNEDAGNSIESNVSTNGSTHPTIVSQGDDQEKLAKRRELLKEDMRQYPAEKLICLLVLWVGLAILTFLKGGKGVDSLVGITCKSPWYGVLIALQFLWLLGFALFFGFKLVRRHAIKVENHYPFHENDVLWDSGKLRFYATFTFIAGIVAGLIGIGGGMVLGPLMLVMGIHPRVSSATTATMIVLTSSSVAIMFVTSGLVPWEYALFFFCICFCGAYIGKKYIDAYVKRTGMASVLIAILAMIIALATVGCFIIVILNLEKANWCFDGFQPFCVSKDVAEMSCNAI